MGISAGTAAIISGVVGAASAGAGAIMSSNAQRSASRAIQNQNQINAIGQNQAFQERMNAGIAQTQAQLDAARTTMADRAQNFTQMRQGQINAQQHETDILNAENAAAEQLRATGDTQAQQLLAATTQQKLQEGQAAAAQHANLLLDQNAPQGPAPTDPQPTAGDTVTGQAIAKRLAQASSNVRTYGAKAADLMSHSQPGQDVGMAILNNKYGIMPAQAAEALLRSGSSTRLAPAQVAFRNAGDLGSAADTLIASRGQGDLDTAALIYNNKVQGSNLAQNDIQTLAANNTAQATADAQYQQSLGNLVSGIGNLGLYGAGRLSGLTIK